MHTESFREVATSSESVVSAERGHAAPIAVPVQVHLSKPSATVPPAASSGLVQMLGLDVRAAVLAIIVDSLIFGSDTLSMGLLIPVGIGAAAVLGIIVYHIQRNWYRDDHASALIKAMTIGLLTAIPVPIAPLLAIPSGCLGLIQWLKRR